MFVVVTLVQHLVEDGHVGKTMDVASDVARRQSHCGSAREHRPWVGVSGGPVGPVSSLIALRD